jgi:hypothetical protein
LLSCKGIRVFHDVPKYAYMQGLFARGGRRISRVLEGMLRGGDWQASCRAQRIDADSQLFRTYGFDDLLPWDFIANTIPKERLWAEYRKALTVTE